MKFQWSKVASVLGSYKDFIHAYSLSINSANFSQDQIAAQLDTIDRRFKQLKATMTSVASGVGSSGLGKFIKDTISNLNAMIQAFQRVPSGVYQGIASIIKWGTILVSAFGTLRLLTKGIIGMQAALKACAAAQAAETLATNASNLSKVKNVALRVLGVNSTRAQATASAAATAGLVAETGAAQGAAVATGELAAGVTVATAGLNLLVAALAIAVLGFFGYTSAVGDAVQKQDDFAQKQADGIEAMGQQLIALEKENEFIGTLCEAHGKLQEQLDTSREGTEEHRQAEEDLAATDQELANIIGDDTASNIDWSKGWQQVMEEEKARHYQKVKALQQDLVNAKQAQLAYTQNQIQWTENRISSLKAEGDAWTQLARVIERFVHMLGSALNKVADFAQGVVDTIKNIPMIDKIGGMVGIDVGSLGSGAIGGARGLASSLQSWSAPTDLGSVAPWAGAVAGIITAPLALPFTAGMELYNMKRDHELEYQQADLEKLKRQEAQLRGEYTQTKIDLLKNNNDTGTLPEDSGGGGTGGGGRTPSGGGSGREISPENELAKQYREAKKEFDTQLAKLRTERERKEQRVTPLEEKDLYEKVIFKNGVNPFESLQEAQRDYANELTKSIKYMNESNKYARESAETQAKAMQKMADAEVSFAEQLGIMSKQDVWQYNVNKNEESYKAKKPQLDEKLVGTLDTSKGTEEDMMDAYNGLINAQNEADRQMYAHKLYALSRDTKATHEALKEQLKLEQDYQQERYKLQQEEYQYKNRYAIKFVDSYVNAWQEGLEGILNRTKSFGDAMRDIFKSIVQSMIKMFSEDMGGKLRKLMSTALHNPKDNGNASGARAGHVDKALDKEKNKITDKAKDELKDSLISSKAVKTAKAQVKDLFSFKHKAAKESAQAVKATSTEELATTTANKTAEQAMHTQVETTETAVTVSQSTARTAATNQAHVNVMKNLGAMMAQMLAAMAVLAIFSSLFKGGSKTETSTSSVNLGRSPDSYYMTPTPVMQSTSFTVPSMDIGGNIEKDMLIFAHKNEMVLTPEQADVIRSTAKNGGSVGGSGSNASIKSNITVSTVDSRGFDRVLRNYNRDLSKQVKKGIRNGYLNANGLV